MIEDKLTHDERLRLECIAQAVALNSTRSMNAGRPVDGVVKDAQAIEEYVRGQS
jgi:hypothetical protein